jgi:hypothetical protein
MSDYEQLLEKQNEELKERLAILENKFSINKVYNISDSQKIRNIVFTYDDDNMLMCTLDPDIAAILDREIMVILKINEIDRDRIDRINLNCYRGEK